jgi:hypothetical protein
MGKARDQLASHRIADAHHHDRDGLRGLPRGEDVLGSRRHDDVDLETHQLGREGGEALVVALRGAVLEHDVAPVLVAQIAQTQLELTPEACAARIAQGHVPEHADPVLLGRRLRRGRPPHRERAGRGQEKEASAPHHAAMPRGPRRRTRPGSAPVCSPPSITTAPFTITVRMPDA